MSGATNSDAATSALVAAITTALLSLIVWPGLMSFDSFFAYRQSIEGVQTAVWPPMHDYLFYVSRKLTGGPGGLFLIQCFVLFFAANSIIGRSFASRVVSVVAMVAWASLFFLFPTLLGTIIVLWKDVALATFALGAVAVWLSCVDRFSWFKFFLVFVLLLVAVSLRYNALPLVVPFMVLILLNPGGRESGARGRLYAFFGCVAVVGGSYATTLWRLPDFQRLPPVSPMVTVIKLWDITGVSACEQKNLLPDGIDSKSRIPDSAFKRLFDPRHANLTFENPLWIEHAISRLGDKPREVDDRWLALVLEHTRCYVSTRSTIFREQFGIHSHQVYYPTHGGIDENIYGISLAFPERANFLIGKIVVWSDHPLRRIYVLHGLALALAGVVILRNRWRYDLPFALGLGILGFMALLYVAAPAADARYAFPSGVFSALLIVLSVARLAGLDRRSVISSGLGTPVVT